MKEILKFSGEIMKKLLVNLSAWLAGGLSLMPIPAFAQTPPDLSNFVTGTSIEDVIGIIQSIIDALALLAGAIAVAYLVYGGIIYITGGAKGAETAKGVIINSIIGMVVILLAYLIANTIVDLF